MQTNLRNRNQREHFPFRSLLLSTAILAASDPSWAQAPVRCDLVLHSTPGVGAASACLDLLALQSGGPAVQVAGNATRIGTDGFKLCKNAFTVQTGGAVDVVFIYDISGSMQAGMAYIDPVAMDTTFFMYDPIGGSPGCLFPNFSGTFTYQTLTGPRTVQNMTSTTGCTGYAGDPYNARSPVIQQAIDYIAQKAPTSTAGTISFNTDVINDQAPLQMNVPANVTAVKNNVLLTDGGGTLYGPPLELAKQWLTDPSIIKTKKQAIVFISDGEPADLSMILPMLDATMPPIYSIFLGKKETPAMATLQQMSTQTKGTFNRVDAQNVSAITKVMEGILQSLIVSTPPQSIQIVNNSLVPPQVSKSTQIVMNADSTVNLVLDSILTLKPGLNEFQVIITSGGVKTYSFKVQADGPAAGSSSSQLICHDMPALVMLNPAGAEDPFYVGGSTAYSVQLKRAASDLGATVVSAVSIDTTRPQPWGDAEAILMPLLGQAAGVATNRHGAYPFEGSQLIPQAGNNRLEAMPSGKVVLKWVHPRDPREFATYELKGGGQTLPVLDLYHAGVKLSAVRYDQLNLEIRLVLPPGETCNACPVEVSPSGSADREVVILSAATGYYAGPFTRELGKPAAGDGRLQHLESDSIVLVYRNPNNPAEVVRRSYPFIAPPAILILSPHGDISRPEPAVPVPGGGNWILVASPDLAVLPLEGTDKCCGRLSWPLSPSDSARYVGVTVEASKPFDVEIQLFSNLGQFVGKVGFSVPAGEFLKLPRGATDSSRVLKVLWGNRAAGGMLAGTGAYIFKTKVDLTSGALRRKNTHVAGLFRQR